MHAGIIFLAVIIGSVLFHIFTPWWWTDIASNWGAMDDTINLTFWIGGGVFILVCLFMVYCILKFSYKEGRKVEYKPEDHKLEKILTIATTVGVIALLAPGLIVYNNYINTPKNALQIEVNAWQWGWQYRLPGEDGILGTAQVILFYLVISFGAGQFSKNKKNLEVKKYLRSVNILLIFIAVIGTILIFFL